MSVFYFPFEAMLEELILRISFEDVAVYELKGKRADFVWHKTPHFAHAIQTLL